jgi:hypothetical protein
MSNSFEDAQNALLSIHEFSPGDDGAPLDSIIDKLGVSVQEPDPFASAHAGLRQSTVSLLYNSSTPPDIIKWLSSTDLVDDKEVTVGRKKVP